MAHAPSGGVSAPRRPQTTFGSELSELLWLRSLTAPHHTYVESAADGRCGTYAELRRVADRWAALLHDLDVPPGATVGLAVADPFDFCLMFIGVMAAGRVAGPLDPGATDAELGAACRRIDPDLVIGDRSPPAAAGAEWVTVPSGAYGLSGGAPETGPVVHPLDEPEPRLAPPGPGGLVLSTSGTTGSPKLIRLDESRLLHTAGRVAAHHELTVADRGFNPLPTYHINAEVVGLLATLTASSTLVLGERFHRRGFWDAMDRHHVTWLNTVPAILARLAPLEPGEAVPAGIRFARSASSPLPPAVLRRFEEATGIPVVETYGMTEAASQITANPLHGPRKPGSVGRPVGTEVRVVPDGQAPAIVGRVGIRGRGVITAYAGPGYVDRFDAEGWLDTGDLGYFDEDGYLFLVGRADDVINRGGEKVLPREVEEVILGAPGVAGAAVVGHDHAVLGSVPVAYLVAGEMEPGGWWQAEALVDRVRSRCARLLSRAKRPVAYHVVDRLPQGATGKVRRHELAAGTPIFSLYER